MHSVSRKFFKLCLGNKNYFNTISSKLFRRLQNENVAPKLMVFSRTFSSSSTAPSPENLQELIFDEVTQGDKEMEHKLKVLMLEVELLRQEGQLVPESDEMEAKNYTELLKLNSRSARKRYLQYLFKLCRKKENRLRKKEENAQKLEENRLTRPPKDIPYEEFAHSYCLQHNSIFLRLRDQTINNVYNNKLIQAIQFGQKLIVDCGYSEKMSDRENSNCAKQLTFLFSENRVHDDPYDLHFCNFQDNSILGKSFINRVPTLYDPEFPLNIHKKSYTEIFPKEKLIYLTPHCKEEMKEYDHDALYIIGAIVDKMNQEPLSMAKAKQENIHMMKFPLDKYLLWTGGSGKSLTLNQVIAILLDVKKTGDWKYALRHVPKRKVFQSDSFENVTKSLLKKREKWAPKTNLNELSFNRGYEKNERSGRRKDKLAVSRLFDE